LATLHVPRSVRPACIQRFDWLPNRHCSWRFKATFCLLLGLVAPHAHVEGQEPWRTPDNVAAIPRAALDSITARGLTLAWYWDAVYHAEEALQATQPRPGLITSHFARKLSDGRWEVVYGHLDPNGRRYRIAFRTIQKQADSTPVLTYEMRPPSIDTGYYLRAARAANVSRRDFFRTPARPYDTLVVPAGRGGEFFVYFVIKPTVPGVWPHGADVRYLVTADGRTIRERRQLHGNFLEYPLAGTPDSAVMAATIYSADLHDRPEDTDVFHVVIRTPRAPAIIVSRSYYFAIDLEGRIFAFNRRSGPRGRQFF
jgi:hypothetical protein